MMAPKNVIKAVDQENIPDFIFDFRGFRTLESVQDSWAAGILG